MDPTVIPIELGVVSIIVSLLYIITVVFVREENKSIYRAVVAILSAIIAIAWFPVQKIGTGFFLVIVLLNFLHLAFPKKSS